MSLRKTSCSACVSTKRRCDRGVPACRRCTTRSLACEYPYPPTTQPRTTPRLPVDEPTLRQRTSSHLLSFANDGLITRGRDEVGLRDMSELACSPLEMAWASSPQNPYEAPALAPMLDANRLNALDSRIETCLESPSINMVRNEVLGYSQTSRLRHGHRSRQRTGYRPRKNRQLVPTFPPVQPTQDIWPRGRDVETWNFCARELLSFVGEFAATASSSFILRSRLQTNSNPRGWLPSSLRKALGVCAAHCTMTEVNHCFFEQLFEAEVHYLIESSTSEGSRLIFPSASRIHAGEIDGSLLAFREALARLQAMTLYQIIGLFSLDARRRATSAHHEPLLASWTRELLLRIQALDIPSRPASSYNSTSVSLSSPAYTSSEELQDPHSVGDERGHGSMTMPRYDPSLQTEEIESAYRTILVSYLVRSVYSALVYQTCTLLAELGSLPVFIPQQQQFLEDPIVGPEQELWSELRQNAAMQGLLDPGSQTISYNNFVDLWTQQRRGLGSEANDRFTILLLVACKGTGIFKS